MDEKKISMRNVLEDDSSIVRTVQSRTHCSRNLLKIKRWEIGLKQYELAFLLGCSAPYLSMVENNRAEATPEFKRKAASIFDIAVDELFPEGN